jgi:hypothetical protein
VKSDKVDAGNLVGLVGEWKASDGSAHEMSDVWFTRERGSPAPSVSELLAAPSPALPGAATSPVVAVDTSPHLHGGWRELQDDTTKFSPLL